MRTKRFIEPRTVDLLLDGRDMNSSERVALALYIVNVKEDRNERHRMASGRALQKRIDAVAKSHHGPVRYARTEDRSAPTFFEPSGVDLILEPGVPLSRNEELIISAAIAESRAKSTPETKRKTAMLTSRLKRKDKK